MPEEKRKVQEDETPTMRKLRVLVYQLGTGTIAFETVIPQAIITIFVIGGAVWMTITGQELPQWLIGSVGLIIGFYFGSDYEFRKLTGKAGGNNGYR